MTIFFFFRQTFIPGNSVIIIMQIRETDIHIRRDTHTHTKTQFLQMLCLCVEFFGSLFFSIEFRMLPFSYSFLIRVTHCCFCWMSFFFRSFVHAPLLCVQIICCCLFNPDYLPSTLRLLRSIPLANSLAIMNDVFDVRLYPCVLTVEITAFFRCVLHFAWDLSKSK